MIRLNWKPLVDFVRNGEFEPKLPDGQTLFMYVEKRNAFVSDPEMLREIQRARSNKNPFMLIGAMGTGKNLFLELVAKGDATGSNRIDCIDENVDGTVDQMMVRFFKRGGIVDTNRTALIHFDLLEHAIDKEWTPFIDTLHELARTGTFYRTDGKKILGLGVRVVGGATEELRPHITNRPKSSFAYLYNYLSTNQLARTRNLRDRVERMPTLLSELLAAQILGSGGAITEAEVKPLEQIAESDLKILRNYAWPGEFHELVDLVKSAIQTGSWKKAIEDHVFYAVDLPKEGSVKMEIIDPTLVFVIMALTDDMAPIFKGIQTAGRATDLTAKRIVDIKGDIRITDEILVNIRKARLIVADLTHERPNVYFELGYARGLYKTVISIARAGTTLHFDVRDWRCIFYSDSRDLEQQLKSRFREEMK